MNRKRDLVLAFVGLSLLLFAVSRVGIHNLLQQTNVLRIGLPLIIVLSFARLILQTLAWNIALRRDGLLFGDRPHESDELTRDGGGNRVRMLAPRQHLPVAPTQAHLRAPGDVANGFRQVLLPGLDLFRHLGPMAIRLGRCMQPPLINSYQY